jgi:hypothetical protein
MVEVDVSVVEISVMLLVTVDVKVCEVLVGVEVEVAVVVPGVEVEVSVFVP